MNIEQVDIDRIIEINKLVYRLARSDDMSDSSLLHNPRSLHSFFSGDFEILPQISMAYTCVYESVFILGFKECRISLLFLAK